MVEGKDDEHVIKHIAGNRGVARFDEIKSHGGVSALLESVPVRLRASEDGDTIGIVIDADTDIVARWEGLRTRLTEIGYTAVPKRPSAEGTVVDPPEGELLPRVGIWIMPNNQTKGILEDFLRFLVPDGSKLFEHVTNSLATIPEGERRFREADVSKAQIHTWLAWQEDPGRAMGTAISARYLDPNVPEVDVFVAWLERLFIL